MMNRSNKKVNKRTAAKKRLVRLLGISGLIVAVLLAAFWFLVVENIRDSVTVEAGSPNIDVRDFLKRDWDIPVELVTSLTQIDLDMPGDYPVQIRYLNRDYDAQVLVRDTQGPEVVTRDLTTFSFYTPDADEFLQALKDMTAVSVCYEVPPDMTREGLQTVSLLLTDESGNTTSATANLTVIFDTQGPVIEGVKPFRIYRGWEVDYLDGVTILDDNDDIPVLEVDDSQVDLTKDGIYPLVYIGRDSSGNVTYEEVTLTLIVDDDPPVIWGVQPISLYTGSTISYRSGIVVTDAVDQNPTLTIDSSGVDLSKAGTYEVIYVARDEAGHETRMTAKVRVKDKKASYVDEKTIYAMVDELLATFITDEMSDREKAEAVYDYIARHYSYYGASDKTDSLQAAYTIMRTHMGDCFNFYAVSKLMLDRLEIPNITVLRGENPYRRTRHYWSLVSVDGGENYYHFDTTPHANNAYRCCLVTDAYLEEFNSKVLRGYYTRDMSLYPATPEEPIE